MFTMFSNQLLGVGFIKSAPETKKAKVALCWGAKRLTFSVIVEWRQNVIIQFRVYNYELNKSFGSIYCSTCEYFKT